MQPIYIYIYVCVYMFVCVYVYLCMCVYVYIFVCVCIFMYVCLCVCMCVCVCIYMCVYVCMYMCMYVYMCVYVCEFTTSLDCQWFHSLLSNLYSIYGHFIIQCRLLEVDLNGCPGGQVVLHVVAVEEPIHLEAVLHHTYAVVYVHASS